MLLFTVDFENSNDVAEEGIGISYDKEPVSPTYKFSSATENAVIRLDKLNIEKRIKAMQNTVDAVDRGMEILSDTEKAIVIARCVKNEYYYQFCYKLRMSERTAKRIKKIALQKMSIVIFGEK